MRDQRLDSLQAERETGRVVCMKAKNIGLVSMLETVVFLESRYMQLKFFSAFMVFAPFCFFAPKVYAIDCVVSTPNLIDPTGALKTGTDHGWFGSERLATMIPQNGHWKGMGPQRNFRDKSWWWYKGYKAESGTANKLTITARNLSSGKETALFRASNAHEGSDNYPWDSMSTTFEFSEEGCWQVIGSFENEKLIINLWVGG